MFSRSYPQLPMVKFDEVMVNQIFIIAISNDSQIVTNYIYKSNNTLQVGLFKHR